MKNTEIQFPILLRTYAGLEEILADEVLNIGGAEVESYTRTVVCKGDLGFIYKSNLALRTALKILKPIHSFTFNTNDDYYKQCFEVPWHELFSVDKTITIDSLLFSEKFNNSMFVSQLTKDAIVDRFRKEIGKRPFVDSKDTNIYISVYIKDNQVTLYLDSSGESLHKRGYRAEQVKAPLSEVMAAGILKLSGWSHHFPLYDPMCGSGTFSIEACLMANNIPPGIFRPGFAFEHWADYDKTLFDQILENLTSKIEQNPLQIFASDRSRVALQIAENNAKEAGVETDIQFSPTIFQKVASTTRKSWLFINPPYGERLQPAEIEELYKTIGATLKHNFSGCEAWLFTSNSEALNHIGLHTSRKIKLYNGPLECRLVRYEMYAGTKKGGAHLL